MKDAPENMAGQPAMFLLLFKGFKGTSNILELFLRLFRADTEEEMENVENWGWTK
jgi:hypothetical protein